MSTDTTEKGLEAHIANYLNEQNGYALRSNTAYDNVACLDRELFFQFLADTQPAAVAKLKAHHKELYEQRVIKRLNDQIQQKGVIEVLRKGITDGYTDTRLKLFYNKPATTYNPNATEQYEANIFSVMRQVYFSPHNRKSLDMMVFINGIPVISFELKNELTKQNVQDAIRQYKQDRDPAEEIFRLGRLINNIALDTEEVWMCTLLKKEQSFFLPFNKGYNNGAGNPPNDGIKTNYLWQEMLTKDSLTNIIQNYCQLVTEEKEYTDAKGKVRTRKEKKLIFPRYHQLDTVRKLLAHAQEHGTGQKYLIQHSAGSGKSNSIAWLAHQLSNLYNKSGNEKIVDTVIVVTDRKVLDKQIRNTIKQFQQVSGVVQPITEGSKQLKQALEEGKQIIITTIQKFPKIVEDIGELPGQNFAIIIDEAHSSISGTLARKLNQTIAKPVDGAEDDDYETEDHDTVTGEDLITDIITSRKLLPNASYFAFTATPKNKTLELFGAPYEDGGKTKYRSPYLYSMKQAIEEGFIEDVLLNYTTYQSYYALLKKIEDDPEYDKKKSTEKTQGLGRKSWARH